MSDPTPIPRSPFPISGKGTEGSTAPGAVLAPEPKARPAESKPARVYGCFYLIVTPLLLLALAALFLGFTHAGRTTVATLLFLPQAFPQTGPTPIDYVTDPPSREEVRFGTGQEYQADVYLPTTLGKHGALIFYLGIQPIDRRDPALVRLAEGLARIGLVVLVPELPALYSGRLDPAESEILIASIEYLQDHPAVAAERIGMSGFSVGAGLMLLAAEDPRINEQVDWINSFGGYFDGMELVRQVLAREIVLPDGTRRTWIPADLTVSVVRRQLIDALPTRDDRVILTTVFFGDQPANSADLAGLTNDGRALYRILTAATAGEVYALLPSLPEPIVAAVNSVSPSQQIDRLQAVVFVMHDRDDPYLPYVQSRALVAALPPEQVAYTEFSLFEHVEPNRTLDPVQFTLEIGRLFGHLYAILSRAL